MIKHTNSSSYLLDSVSAAHRLIAFACQCFAFLLLHSLLASQLSAKDILRIGYIGWDRQDPICQAIGHGAMEYAKALESRYRRIEIVTVHPSEVGPTHQRDAFFNILTQQIDGLILGPDSSTAFTAEHISIATEMDIPVVILREQLPQSEVKPLATITMDENKAGTLAMETMLQALRQSQSTFAVIHQQDKLLTRHKPRMEAAIRTLQAYNNQREPFTQKQARFYHAPDSSISELVNLYNKAKAEDTHGEIDGWLLLGSWPVIGPGLYPVRSDSPPYSIVLMDTPPSALTLIANGHIAAGITTDYASWGQKAVEILSGKIEFSTEPVKKHIQTEPTLINASNTDAWQAKWAQWML